MPGIGGDQLDDRRGMGGRALPTTQSLTSGNDTRRESVLVCVLLSRQYRDCEPAGERFNVKAVGQDSALCYSITATALDWGSNLLLCCLDGGRYAYQQANLRRWGRVILLSAPSLDVDQMLQVRKDLLLRYPSKLTQVYK